MIRELEFQLLCQRHADEIYRYARGLLGDQTEAEDATQEVLLRLWNHLPTIRVFQIRAWLFRTMRNYCLDQLRRRSHRSGCVPLDDELAESCADDRAVDPSLGADSTFRLEQARSALLKLPEPLRGVFVLYEVNGLRYREIADTLGMPINTVKVSLLRARARLAKLIHQEESWTRTCKS